MTSLDPQLYERLCASVREQSAPFLEPELAQVAVAVDLGAQLGILSDTVHAQFVSAALKSGLRFNSLRNDASERFVPRRFHMNWEHRGAGKSEVAEFELREPQLDDLLGAVLRVSDEPGYRQVLAASMLGRELRGIAEQLVDSFISDARAAGASWAQVLYAALERPRRRSG